MIFFKTPLIQAIWFAGNYFWFFFISSPPGLASSFPPYQNFSRGASFSNNFCRSGPQNRAVCLIYKGLLDWFEVDLGFTEHLFIEIDLCVVCVFVLYSRVSLSWRPFLDILHCLPRSFSLLNQPWTWRHRAQQHRLRQRMHIKIVYIYTYICL